MVDLVEDITRQMALASLEFRVRGILSFDDKLYPLSTDTKVLSTIFELIVRPQVTAVAAKNDLILREPLEQNYYPDFTLMRNESRWPESGRRRKKYIS